LMSACSFSFWVPITGFVLSHVGVAAVRVADVGFQFGVFGEVGRVAVQEAPFDGLDSTWLLDLLPLTVECIAPQTWPCASCSSAAPLPVRWMPLRSVLGTVSPFSQKRWNSCRKLVAERSLRPWTSRTNAVAALGPTDFLISAWSFSRWVSLRSPRWAPRPAY